MFYNLKMNALACLFLMTGNAIQAAENIPPSQVADKDGSFISKTRDSIPPFPSSVRGFYYDPGKDFWGKPFQETGSIRVFEGDNWVGLADFPNSSNGCSSGRFMVRWRSNNPDVVVTASLGYGDSLIENPKSGIQGYLLGSNCHRPLFKFSHAKNGNSSTLVDVYYEVRFWHAGV